MKVLEDTPPVLSQGKLCDEHGYSHEWINGQKPHLIKNGIRIQCNTENFVPIMVPGLSTSSSSSLPSSTFMTPSTVSSENVARQERADPYGTDHPPSTVSSESANRKERGDPYGTDHPPSTVSSESVERQDRRDPYSSETSKELLNKPSKNPKPNKNEDHEQVRGDPYYSDIPEWLQKFRESRG